MREAGVGGVTNVPQSHLLQELGLRSIHQFLDLHAPNRYGCVLPFTFSVEATLQTGECGS